MCVTHFIGHRDLPDGFLWWMLLGGKGMSVTHFIGHPIYLVLSLRALDEEVLSKMCRRGGGKGAPSQKCVGTCIGSYSILRYVRED